MIPLYDDHNTRPCNIVGLLSLSHLNSNDDIKSGKANMNILVVLISMTSFIER